MKRVKRRRFDRNEAGRRNSRERKTIIATIETPDKRSARRRRRRLFHVAISAVFFIFQIDASFDGGMRPINGCALPSCRIRYNAFFVVRSAFMHVNSVLCFMTWPPRARAKRKSTCIYLFIMMMFCQLPSCTLYTVIASPNYTYLRYISPALLRSMSMCA